jgi:hypothetical protein
MQYDIYEGNKLERYLLGKSGTKLLFVIGLNPSTADNENDDVTTKKIKGFIANNKSKFEFDSFVLVNLYPQRTPHPDKLHEEDKFDINLHNQNVEKISKIISSQSSASILAVWGAKIHKRKYLTNCLQNIYDTINNSSIKWLQIGELTNSGHPRHPSRAPYNYPFQEFKVEVYLETVTKKSKT